MTPDGNKLFSGGSGSDTETRIHRWSLTPTVKFIGTFAENIHDLNVLQVSPRGRWLLSHGSYLDDARFHDLTSPGSAATAFGFGGDMGIEPPFDGGVLSADGRWVILRSAADYGPNGVIKLVDGAPTVVLSNRRTGKPDQSPHAIAFDSTSRWMLASDMEHRLELWDVSGDLPIRSETDSRHLLATSSDYHWFALAEKAGCIDVFELSDPHTAVLCVPAEHGKLDAIELGTNRTWLAIGKKTDNKRLQWTLSKVGESVAEAQQIGDVEQLRFVTDNLLVGWGGQTQVMLWKLKPDGIWQPYRLSGHRSPVTHLTWTRDGRCLISASGDATVRLWDPAKPEQDSVVLRGHQAGISAITLASDDRLVSGDTRGEIRIWRLWKSGAASADRLAPLIRVAKNAVGREFTASEKAEYQIAE